MASPDRLECEVARTEKAEKLLGYRFEKLLSTLSYEAEEWVPQEIINIVRSLCFTFYESTELDKIKSQFTFGTAPKGKELDLSLIENSPYAILNIDENFFNNLDEIEQQEQLAVVASKVHDFNGCQYSEVRSHERALGYKYDLREAREDAEKLDK